MYFRSLRSGANLVEEQRKLYRIPFHDRKIVDRAQRPERSEESKDQGSLEVSGHSRSTWWRSVCSFRRGWCRDRSNSRDLFPATFRSLDPLAAKDPLRRWWSVTLTNIVNACTCLLKFVPYLSSIPSLFRIIARSVVATRTAKGGQERQRDTFTPLASPIGTRDTFHGWL